MTIGTRRTMASRSGMIVNSPRPAAASSKIGMVRLGEDNVKSNRGCSELGQPRDEFGNAGARPRPLAQLAKALFVDIDYDNRPLRRDAWRCDLKNVEGPQAQVLKRRWIGKTQEQQREQQGRAKYSRGNQTTSLSGKPFHVGPAGCSLAGAAFGVTSRGTCAFAGRAAVW